MHLSADQIRRALTLRDLTDPGDGPSALQVVLDQIEDALRTAWRLEVRRARAHPVVSLAENYDRLRIGSEAVSREARYTRYLNEHTILRTHTTAMIPPLLDVLAREQVPDVVLSCAGLVYRRDVVDRRHVGEPHQADLWRIRTEGARLGTDDLQQMIELVVEAALPGLPHRTVPAVHPYTTDGLQIDVRAEGEWVEVGECGLAHPEVLAAAGLDGATGLAMGIGLDRLVMVRKRIGDIRLLRSADPRIASQMLDLEPYRPVSSMPPVRRDLSIAIARDVTAEEIGDRARAALGDDADALESVEVTSEAGYESLPDSARARLGMDDTQKNVLVRVVIRHLERTLTDAEANAINNRLYDALHEGTGRDHASNSSGVGSRSSATGWSRPPRRT